MAATTVSLFSKSIAYKIAPHATDADTIVLASQEASFTQGLINEVTGIFDGGKSGSVGLSHTIGEVGKVYAGMAAQRALLSVPGLPLTNGLRG